MSAPRDLGNAIAEALLAAAADAAASYGLDVPASELRAAGSAIPTEDACDGLLWARVATAHPTDGSGQPMTATRFDSSVPAWAFLVELGVLWCHANITEDGGYTSAADETDLAERDGQWRLALLTAAGFGWRSAAAGTPLGEAVSGQLISPWSAIGPDGGYSGGLVVVTAIATGLAICG